jgi:hypothetical protein
MITQKPIPWGPLPDPWTLVGNVHWTNYRLSAKVHLMGKGSAMLLGRIDSANAFADKKARLPSGYVFRITSGGRWSLLCAAYNQPTRTLAHGGFEVQGNKWRKIELVFRGNRISASLDGKVLASVHDNAHTHGMFGIGTGWNHAQFDNVSIARNK